MQLLLCSSRRSPQVRVACAFVPALAATSVFATFARAQQPATPGASPATPPVSVLPLPSNAPTAPLRNGKYLLAPGDVLRVTVANYPAYNQENVVVPPDGVLALPYFDGIVRATGKTRESVQAQLTRILSQKMISPRVVVTLVRARSDIAGVVFVSGSVNRPGAVDIRDGYRLTDLLSLVGGVQGRIEELNSTLARRNGPVIKLDLRRAMSYPNSSANLRLRPDDAVTIMPMIAQRITITGDVLRSGNYELHKIPNRAVGSFEMPLNARLSDALLAAGLQQPGLEQGKAIEFKGTLTRRGRNRADVKIPLDVEQARLRRDSGANVRLLPDDLVDIEAVRPPAPVAFFVDGFVRAPGGFTLPEGSGVMEALAQAGGITRLPEDTSGVVVRAGRVIPLDFSRLLMSNDPTANLPLQPGDIVRVSEPPKIRVQVTGLVRTAQTEPLRLPPNARLQDALTAAGGVSAPPQDIVISILRRRADGTPLPLRVDPVRLLNASDVSQNVELKDGDLVGVADANRARTVTLSGEVARQGQYVVREGDTIVDLIGQAGGVTGAAQLTTVRIGRNNQNITLDLLDAVGNKTPVTDPAAILQQGDYIVVPRNEAGVYLMGAINTQGILPVPERKPLTVLDAVSRAGGFAGNARPQEVILLRQQRDASGKVVRDKEGNPIIQRDFLSLAGNGKKVAFNTLMQPGDVLYVPQQKATRNGLQTAQTVLGAVGGVIGFGRFVGG